MSIICCWVNFHSRVHPRDPTQVLLFLQCLWEHPTDMELESRWEQPIHMWSHCKKPVHNGSCSVTVFYKWGTTEQERSGWKHTVTLSKVISVRRWLNISFYLIERKLHYICVYSLDCQVQFCLFFAEYKQYITVKGKQEISTLPPNSLLYYSILSKRILIKWD